MRFNLGTIASRLVIVVTGATSVTEAARLMRSHHVGSLVVMASAAADALPIGIVTDRDLVVEVLAQEVEPPLVKVGDVMSKTLVTARADDALFDAVEQMRRHGVRRLVVVDDEGGLVGLVSMDDLIGILAEELGGMSKALAAQVRAEEQARPLD